MASNRQEKLYLPENPLIHTDITRNGRLKFFSSISESRFGQNILYPCIIFVGHPSLRFGDVVNLVKVMGQNPKNSLMLIEPEFNYQEAISAFEPFMMK